MTELLQDLETFLRTLHWAWLLVTIIGGIIVLYFGYRLYETLKFLIGFVVGGTLIGALLYPGNGQGAAVVGFLLGGVISGFLFRAVVNAIPPLIGALVFAVPTLLFFDELTPSWLPPLPDPMVDWRSIAVALAAIAGGMVGRWLSQAITVVGTSFLGTMLITASVAKIHVELDDFTATLLTEPSTYFGWKVAYAVAFLCLLSTGIWYQSRWIIRQGTTNTAVRPDGPRKGGQVREAGSPGQRPDPEVLLSLGILVVLLVNSSSSNDFLFVRYSLSQLMREFSGPKSDYLDVLRKAQEAIHAADGMGADALFRTQVSKLRAMDRSSLLRISRAVANLEGRMNSQQRSLVQLMQEDTKGARQSGLD